MKNEILVVVFVAAGVVLFRGKANAAPTLTPAAVEKILIKCVDEQKRAPGIAIGWIDKNGANVLARGDVNTNSIFEIGSITKVFTSLLLQDMADHGEVSLDDPVAKYLPASVSVPSRNGKQITLRQLATHTSGLPRLPANLSPADDENPYADYTVANLYEFLSTCKLRRDPGAKSEYSNLGMGLLGHALSLKAGMGYETMVVNRICNPLGLDSCRITLTPPLRARLAQGHNEAGAPVGNWDIPTLAGAGALRSSAGDLLKFLGAEMGLTPSSLSPAMIKTQQPQKGAGFLSKEGLGWQIDNLGGLLWHNGGTGGYRSYMAFLKDKSLGVVVLADSANDIDDIGQYLLGDRSDIEDFEAPKKHVIAKIDYSLYDKYVGRYKFSLAPAYFTITRDGNKLMAQLTGQSAYEVYPESPTEFFYTVVDAQLTFITNASGEATRLILHQNGIDQTTSRVK